MERLTHWFVQKQFPDDFIRYIRMQLMDPLGELTITGSLALMLMTQETNNWWDVGDVDFICTFLDHRRIDDIMYGRYGITFSQPINQQPIVRESVLYKNALLTHVDTRFVPTNGFKIQFLCVNPSQIESYVRTFDLSFCQIIIGKGTLKILHPLDVCRRTMKKPISVDDIYFPENIISPFHLYHNYLPRRYFRLCKYNTRGFDFTLTLTSQLYEATQRTLIDDFEDSNNEYRKGVLMAFWHMFWDDRIDRNGKIVLDKFPEWKR